MSRVPCAKSFGNFRTSMGYDSPFSCRVRMVETRTRDLVRAVKKIAQYYRTPAPVVAARMTEAVHR
jgi:hypothetical protein